VLPQLGVMGKLAAQVMLAMEVTVVVEAAAV
jgi:hypothetical protein